MEEQGNIESPVETVRRNIRELSFQERKEQREKQFNKKRGILGEVLGDEQTYSPQIVKQLAEKLKQKTRCNNADYVQLSRCLIQSEENIVAFFKVPGAFQGLIRDFTGQNASLQLAAANCCCNLALGNEKSCLQLTKAAAAYLILNLNGLNYHLVEICAWTLGNLAGSHDKCWLILQAQGLMPKLLQLTTTSNTNVRQSAIYALTHYVRIGMNSGLIESDILVNIASCAQSLMEVEHSTLWLLHLLSCCIDCDEVFMKNSVVKRSVQLLTQYESTIDVDADTRLTTALVRILGNLCAGQCATELLCLESFAVFRVLKLLLSSQHLYIKRETLWLIGNLVNHSSQEIRNAVGTSNLVRNLEPCLSAAAHEVS